MEVKNRGLPESDAVEEKLKVKVDDSGLNGI